MDKNEDLLRIPYVDYGAWDGPAAINTDGKKIGATLDRNGLRPARYFVSEDNVVLYK